MGKRKRYSKEFKIEAVRLMAEVGNVRQVARDLGVAPDSLHKWRRQLSSEGDKAFPGKGHPRDEELSKLQRENARLREEVVILKKAVGIFTSRPE